MISETALKRFVSFVNPFRTMKKEDPEFSEVIAGRIRARDAKQKLDEILSQYKDLMEDKRYSLVRDQARRLLGSQLSELVEVASKCSNCCAVAGPVKFLRDVVDAPAEVVWYEAQRSRLEPPKEELS